MAELTGKSQALFVVSVQPLQKDARPLLRHHQAFTCTGNSISVRCAEPLWSHIAAGNTGWPHIKQCGGKPLSRPDYSSSSSRLRCSTHVNKLSMA